MKIYTRAGDQGETSLYGGQSLSKQDIRIQALGTVDECNAGLGLALASITDPLLRQALARIQSELFELGADLATPLSLGSTVPRIKAEQITRLEEEIDVFENELPPLRNFILPGGASGGAALHLARCVCRRAERHTVSLASQEKINPEALKYLNRLSDYLFVAARLLNHRLGQPETIWERPAAV